MAIVDLIMPKMGESIMEATILKWYKRVGDHIQQDETLLDIATDKVDSEVPSSVEGTISEILYDVNDVVAVGNVIARVQTSNSETTPVPIAFSTLDNEVVKPVMPIAQVPATLNLEPKTTQQPISTYTSMPVVENTMQENIPFVPQNVTLPNTPNNNHFFSPLVLNIANSQGISLSELEKIKGTGEDSRVSKKDILQYVPENATAAKPTGNNRFFSPLVLNIANSEGLSLSELERIEGTGADGRVSKRDVLQYIADKKAGYLPIYTAPVIPIIETAPQETIQSPIVVSAPIPIQPIETVPEPIAVVPEPVAIIPKPIAVVPEPITVVSEPVTVLPEPIAVVPEPITVVPEPITVVPKPITVVPKPVAVVTEPVAVVPEPVTVVPEPVAVVPEPVAVVPEPVAVVPEPVAVVPEPVIVVPKPIALVPEPVVVKETSKVEAPIIEEEEEVVTETVKEEPIEEEKKVLATSINQTCIQPVQQSVFVPTPIYSQDIPLSTLAEGETGKFANPTSALPSGDTEIIEMDRMRKLIAKHMVNSVQTSPHVTSFVEADVTNMVLWRNRVKADFEKREGTKITFTPMFIECLVKAMKQFPLINSSINGDNIVVKKDFNIGMATALPSGNLIVPVIKSAEKLNIVGLSKAVNNLASAARNSQLKPDDTSGGTFTFTNVGTFGSLMGTPIINQPQVAILAVGVIKKRPVVIESESGDTIGIRHMMYLSLSYDHRVIDGSIGASFLSAVAKAFEQWDVNRTWYQYT